MDSLYLDTSVTLSAMKFYPLNKEKMEEIQSEIVRIKAETLAKQKYINQRP